MAAFNTRVKPHTDGVDFTNPTISVIVGKPSKLFNIHEKKLRASSNFFEAALGKNWKEKEERLVRLPEDCPDAFNIWLNWIHSRNIVLGLSAQENPKEHGQWTLLVDTYMLGDKLLDFDFKDAVLDAMGVLLTTPYKTNTYFPPASARQEIYEKTTEDSKMRKLLVHSVARLAGEDQLDEADSAAFLLDVAKMTMTTSTETTATAIQKCTFHEHKAGADNCYRKKYA